jgi:hypothetical protein
MTMPINRRQLVVGAAGIALAGRAAAQETAAATQWPPAESVRLWPGRPPGSPRTLPRPDFAMNGNPPRRELHLRGVADPVIGVYRSPNPDGPRTCRCRMRSA